MLVQCEMLLKLVSCAATFITTATLSTNTVTTTTRFGLLLKEAIHQQNDLSSSILPVYLLWLTLTSPWIMTSVQIWPTSIIDQITWFKKGHIFATTFQFPHLLFPIRQPNLSTCTFSSLTKGKKSGSLHFTPDFHILTHAFAVLKWDRLPTQRLGNIKSV